MLADFVVDNSGDTKRTDKSLGILTRKFVQILQKTSNGVLDLKYVSFLLVEWFYQLAIAFQMSNELESNTEVEVLINYVNLKIGASVCDST